MMYALGSNIVSYILKRDKLLLAKLAEAERQGNILRIPSVVYYEVGRGLAAVNAMTKQAEFPTKNTSGEETTPHQWY